MSTKTVGNKAVSVILSEFVKNEIPVMLPFGDNEKYDLVIEIKGIFRSVQVKSGRFLKGRILADTRHRIGVKRIKYETYGGKVDFIAIWCEEIKKSYLIPISEGNKTLVSLRIDKPIKNSCITKIVWAEDYEFSKILKKYCGFV